MTNAPNSPVASETVTEDGGPRFGRSDVIALAFLTVACLVVLWPIIAVGLDIAPGLPGHDARSQWYPWRAYAAESIKSGTLPLWNPYVLCGTPFAGNFQSALFYPPNAIFLVCRVAVAARISIVFHIWLSLLFTYLLARYLGCRRPAACVSAMAFGFCGAQLLRIPAGHWGLSCAIPWLPLILLCVEMTLRKLRWLVLVSGACAVALQVLSGAPQYVFITAIAVGVYAILRGIGAGLSQGERWQRWGVVALIFALGGGIAGIQLLPGFEWAANGARSLPMSESWIKQFSLAPESLLTLLVPGFFGGARNVLYWGRYLFWEMNGYVGIIALTLALYALLSRRSRGLVLRIALLSAVMLLLALGRHTPLMELFMALPGAGMFRGSAKFLLPFSLCIALLAGLGMEALLCDWEGRRWRPAIRAGLPVVAGVAILFLLGAVGRGQLQSLRQWVLSTGVCFPDASRIKEGALVEAVVSGGLVALTLLATTVLGYAVLFRSKSSRAIGIFSGLVLLVVFVDGVQFSRLFLGPERMFEAKGSAWPENGAELLRFMGGGQRVLVAGCLEMNDGMLERVPTMEGIAPNPPVRFHQLFQLGQGLPIDMAPSWYQFRGGAVGRATAYGRLLMREDAGGPDPNADIAWSADGWVLQNLRHAVPRASVVYESTVAASPEDALKLTLTSDLKRLVVLEEGATQSEGGSGAAAAPVRFLKDSQNCVRIEGILDRPGWLVLVDNHFPGWTVDVDGEPAKLLRANFAFRAVALPAGEHGVTFRYRPASLKLGFALSMASLLACAAMALFALKVGKGGGE